MQYFKEFERFSPPGEAPWLEILSRDPDRLLQSSEDSENAEAFDLTPFKGCSVEEVYEFFKRFLRSSGDSALGGPFTHFTFIVVDQACLTTKPLSCIVCCDAPDFAEAEDEIKLKSIRMDLDDATSWLPAFEELLLTPEEYDDNEEFITFDIMPPPTMRFAEIDEHYLLAPMAQARRNKRRALKIIEEAITKQAREARANKKGTSRGPEVDQQLTEARDVSEGNSQDFQGESLHGAPKGDDQEEGSRPEVESEARIDPASEDITVKTCSKVDVVHASSRLFLRQIRHLLYQDRNDQMLIRLVDNRTKERSRSAERTLAKQAAGPSRPVYSLERRVYGPIVQGKEDPVIVSKGRDVGLSKRSDTSSGSE